MAKVRRGRYSAYMRMMVVTWRVRKLPMLLNRRDGRVTALVSMGTWVMASLWLPAWMMVSTV